MKMKTAPELKVSSSKTFSVGIAVADFNPHITGEMLKTAKEFCKKENLVVEQVLEVPGSLEIPFACQRLFKQKKIQGVIALGAIIKGSTSHDQIIGATICDALVDLSLKFDKPLGMGISGPGQTEQQATERAEEYARRAVLAVKQMLLL